MQAVTEGLPYLHPSPFHGQEKKRGRKKKIRETSLESNGSVDGSLTSLTWLQDFKIPDISSRELYQTSLQSKTIGNDHVFVATNECDKEPEKEDFFISISPLRRCLLQSAEFYRDPNKYREDPYKPPLSYTTLIFLAIQASKKDKVMLSEIYQWIRDHFLYYRLAEPTWQNSVRHNLSLNEFFTKVPRAEGSTGKGSFWKVSPEYEHFLSQDREVQRLTEYQIRQQGIRSKTKARKRAQSQNGNGKREIAPSRKRPKSISMTVPADPCHLPGDLDWVSLLSSQRMMTCSSCTDSHNCRPTFGSPVLGPPDLGHIGDPVICSPAVIPSTLISRVPDTPPVVSQPTAPHQPFITIDETMISSHESPSPLLPRWAESRSQSPSMALEHPWADTKDGLLRSACNMDSLAHIWPSDMGWSSLPQSGYPCKASSKMPIAQNM